MHLFRIALGALALVSLPLVANAADVAPRRAAPAYVAPAPPVYNWTGFYLGGHVGYGWVNASVENSSASASGDSAFGGFQLGYNWQAIGSPWVWGLEADASFGGSSTWFGTGRVRAGYANGAWMPYLTGGVAWASTEVDLGSFSDSRTRAGWTLGGGAEWAFAPQWTAKLEYLYLDLGRENYNLGGNKFDASFAVNTVKLGVNYRFASY